MPHSLGAGWEGGQAANQSYSHFGPERAPALPRHSKLQIHIEFFKSYCCFGDKERGALGSIGRVTIIAACHHSQLAPKE
jgi:hypothetical protein